MTIVYIILKVLYKRIVVAKYEHNQFSESDVKIFEVSLGFIKIIMTLNFALDLEGMALHYVTFEGLRPSIIVRTRMEMAKSF